MNGWWLVPAMVFGLLGWWLIFRLAGLIFLLAGLILRFTGVL